MLNGQLTFANDENNVGQYMDKNALTQAKDRLTNGNMNFETNHLILLHCKHRTVEIFTKSTRSIFSPQKGVRQE